MPEEAREKEGPGAKEDSKPKAPPEPKEETKPKEVPKPKEEPKAKEAQQPAKAKEKPKALLEKPTNCMKCNKHLQRKRWYYREGGYYCSKRCWKLAVAAKKKETKKV